MGPTVFGWFWVGNTFARLFYGGFRAEIVGKWPFSAVFWPLGGVRAPFPPPKPPTPAAKLSQNHLQTVLERFRNYPDPETTDNRPQNHAGVVARAFEPQNGRPVTYNPVGGANGRKTGAARWKAGGLRAVWAAQEVAPDFFRVFDLLIFERPKRLASLA